MFPAQGDSKIKFKNSIENAPTPHPGEIVLDTMKYTAGEGVQRSGDF